MGGSEMNLPAGYTLETPAAPSLPAGYELEQAPGELESFARGAGNNFPLAPQAIATLAPGGYSQNLADWNAKAAEAKAANPISYGAGAVTGTVAPFAIPGIGPGMSAALKAEPVLANAGLGALSAISNTDLLKNPGDAVKDAAIGGTIGAGIGKLGSMLPGGEDILAKATSPEAVAAKLANPGMEAGDVDAMARALPNTFGKMKQIAGHLSDNADSLLTSSPYLQEGAIPKDDVFKVLQSARNNIGGRSGESASAARTLDAWAEELKTLKSTVSQSNLKDVIRDIDKDIPWDKIRFQMGYQPTMEEAGLMKLRGGLNDILTTANPEYGAEMGKIKDILDTSSEFAKKFGLERHEGTIVPGDQTVNRLNTALKGSKTETQRVLGKTLENTGEDIETPLLLRQFKGPTPENPAGVPSKIGAGLVGAAFGHGLGIEGMGLGAVLGHRALHEPMSIAGRRGSEWILDTVSANPALRQFLPSLSQAAQRGANSLIANHYILMQQSPEYNKAFTESMDGKTHQ